MFERILVPLDGSPRAELVLAQIGRILKREDAEILLLQVVHHDLAPFTDSGKMTGQDRDAAQAYLHEMAKRIGSTGKVKVHARVAEGPPAETILKFAETEGATMIALSTHGRSGVARWTMGSVAEKLLRASKVPVLMVRSFRRSPHGDFEPALPQEFPFRRILVPVDGSAASLAAVTPAEKVGLLYDSEMLVVHVVPPWPPSGAILPGMEAAVPEPVPPPPSDADPATAKAAERLRHSGLKVVRRTIPGDPAAELVDLTHASGVDLVVMSTHGRSGIARWMLGSVAERVLRSIGVPILLVRSS